MATTMILPVVTWSGTAILAEIAQSSASGDLGHIILPSTLMAHRIELSLPAETRSPKGFPYDPDVTPDTVLRAVGAIAVRQSPVYLVGLFHESLRLAARQGSIAGMQLHIEGASMPLHVCADGYARVPEKAIRTEWLPSVGDYLHDSARSGILERYPALREIVGVDGRGHGGRFSQVEILYLPIVATPPDPTTSAHDRLGQRRRLRDFAAAIYPMHSAQIAPVLMPGDPVLCEPRS